MGGFLARQARSIVTGALAPVEAVGARFIQIIGIAGIAVLCVLATLIFLSVALDLWLAQIFGPVIAALGTAGLYLLAALLCLLLLQMQGRKRRPKNPGKDGEGRNAAGRDAGRDKTKAVPEPAAAIAADAEPSPRLAANLDETLAPFLAILQQSGLKREEVALRLASATAKELGPLALLGLAVAAGFICQRSLKPKP